MTPPNSTETEFSSQPGVPTSRATSAPTQVATRAWTPSPNLPRYVLAVRPSSRVAFGISWVVFVVAVFLSWREVLSVPNSDVNGLAFATVAGALGLGLLGAWLQDREGGRKG